jgi:hypothetical protein
MMFLVLFTPATPGLRTMFFPPLTAAKAPIDKAI